MTDKTAFAQWMATLAQTFRAEIGDFAARAYCMWRGGKSTTDTGAQIRESGAQHETTYNAEHYCDELRNYYRSCAIWKWIRSGGRRVGPLRHRVGKTRMGS